jgi:hypothetical protein
MNSRWMSLVVVGVLGTVASGCAGGSKGGSGHVGPGTGMAASALLGGSAPALRVEIDYVTDRAPSPAAIARLRERLVQHTGKEVEVVVDDALPRTHRETRWTLAELRELEAAHRDFRGSAEVASMWIVYVEGEGDASLGPWPVGYAFGPTSIAVFADQVRAAAPVSGGNPEAWVLVHESGHLLGLVGQGAAQQHFHMDVEHPGHCSEPSCVMASTADSRHDDFGPECAADLRAARGR